VQSGNNNPLAWRALGIMSYIYNNDKDFALVCLHKAYVLSNHIDIEAVRLKGQILLGTHSLTYLLTHSLTHSLTYLLTHLFTHLPTYSPTHSLTHSLTYY
jgi:hypothetical protein